MTRVVVMDLSRYNTVMVGHDRYFVLDTDGRRLLVRDHCPHRGGPLSLARRTPDGRRLSCPWHGTKVGVAAVRRTSLPMVRSGDEAVVLLPSDTGPAPVSVIHKEILANLPPEEPCAADGLVPPAALERDMNGEAVACL
ncbi:Rieske (2Fe-2S) protein [Actinomadura roseirufa]|uniref:Rieske (2Fe-2S) protein n=1 Tax=Actinomadura roseirufa TaxID=2094049 RepID=UPI00104170C5|nr:Rieske 2Fe-2S domain-containing protein [Actinomadura roseirufa]